MQPSPAEVWNMVLQQSMRTAVASCWQARGSWSTVVGTLLLTTTDSFNSWRLRRNSGPRITAVRRLSGRSGGMVDSILPMRGSTGRGNQRSYRSQAWQLCQRQQAQRRLYPTYKAEMYT